MLWLMMMMHLVLDVTSWIANKICTSGVYSPWHRAWCHQKSDNTSNWSQPIHMSNGHSMAIERINPPSQPLSDERSLVHDQAWTHQTNVVDFLWCMSCVMRSECTWSNHSSVCMSRQNVFFFSRNRTTSHRPTSSLCFQRCFPDLVMIHFYFAESKLALICHKMWAKQFRFFFFYYYWQAICAVPYCFVFCSRTLRTNNNSLLFMITHIIVLVDLFELWIHARARTMSKWPCSTENDVHKKTRERQVMCAVCSLVAHSPWARAWSVCDVCLLLIHNNVNTMLGHVLRL